MPELNEEYVEGFLERLKALLFTDNICLIKTDEDQLVLCEIWHHPNRAGQDNEYEIYPLAKLLTEEETQKLKIDGEMPT